MSAASVTNTSYVDADPSAYQDGASTIHQATPPLPPRPLTTSSIPLADVKKIQPTPTSAQSTPVPISATLPVTIPSDLIPASASWTASVANPFLIHPTTWTELSSTGPFPFTTLVTYQLPQSGALATWEARRHRRQVEQFSANVPAAVEERRAALARPWWSRILRVHLKRWSWWAVLWFNVGSHALVYAAICLFIPYFNDNGRGIYQANTGWSSNVLAAIFWLAGSLFELAALLTEKPASKWYQVPRPMLSSNRKKVDPRVYDCAYVDDPTAQWKARAVLRRMDFWIILIRMAGFCAFVVATVAYSGAFTLDHSTRIAFVFAAGIFAATMLLIGNYMSLAECCHQWAPVKRGMGLGASLRFMDWWINVLATLASLALLAYYIDLTCQPQLLDPAPGPGVPLHRHGLPLHHRRLAAGRGAGRAVRL